MEMDLRLKAILARADEKLAEAIDIHGQFLEQCAIKALSLGTGFAIVFDENNMQWAAVFGPNRHVPNSTYYELPRG